jgi:hypothetical protein
MHGAENIKLVDNVASNYFPNSSKAIHSIFCRRENHTSFVIKVRRTFYPSFIAAELILPPTQQKVLFVLLKELLSNTSLVSEHRLENTFT